MRIDKFIENNYLRRVSKNRVLLFTHPYPSFIEGRNKLTLEPSLKVTSVAPYSVASIIGIANY